MNITDKQYQQILDHIGGELRDQEKVEFELWLNESEANKAYYQSVLKKTLYVQWSLKSDKVNTEQEFRKFENKLGARLRYLSYAAIAASLIMLFSIGGQYIWSEWDTNQNTLAQISTIKPGSSKAILQLHNGNTIQLESVISDSIQENDGTIISNQKGNLAYTSNAKVSEKPIYNSVVVPVGGEYELTLADGTKVWLNSDSEIRYPVQFIGDKRKVWIAGEVCFDVAHNKQKPFIVEAKDVEVEVLGTTFNVEAYRDKNSIVTTLVEGSVKLSKENESVIIEPNQQAVISDLAKEFAVSTVDAKNYTLWKDGIFYFEEAPLNTIMEKLERWYGIKVFFMNRSISEKRFSIEVKRYEEIESVLDILSRTEKVYFDINENVIVVRN